MALANIKQSIFSLEILIIIFTNCNNCNLLAIFFVSHYISIIGLVFLHLITNCSASARPDLDIRVSKNGT